MRSYSLRKGSLVWREHLKTIYKYGVMIVDNGDSSIDSALRLRSTIKPPACNDADKEMLC